MATAESPRATDRKRGITKKRPDCSMNWKKNAVSPPWRRGSLSMRGSSRAPWWRCSRLLSHSAKRPRTAPPPSSNQTTGDIPSHCGASGLGWTKPQVPDRMTPYTITPRPAAESSVPTGSRRTPGTAGESAIRHVREKDAEHQDHLAHEDPAPTGVRREQPADQRADRHGDGARRGDEPVGPRPLGAAEVRRHQRHHGRHDQRGTEPFQHRPAEDQDREGLGQGGDGRATPVDDAADHEGPLAPDDLPDLAARDHEGRHDERVEGDGELDPGDRGPDVLGHRGDGDIHDRGVQGHEELGRRQRHQDDLPAG